MVRVLANYTWYSGPVEIGPGRFCVSLLVSIFLRTLVRIVVVLVMAIPALEGFRAPFAFALPRPCEVSWRAATLWGSTRKSIFLIDRV